MSVLDVNGVTLAYRELGNPNKPAFVFAHPVLFGSYVFDPLVYELQNDFRLIVLDIHGHGESGYRSPLTLEDMTNDYHELLTKLNVPKLIWIGFSIGGMLGLRFTLKYPERMNSLILISATVGLDSPQLREQITPLWNLFREGHREDIVDAATQFFFSNTTRKNQPDLVKSYREKIVRYDRDQGAGIYEAAHAVLNRKDISDRLYDIKVPALVISGKEDASPSPAESEMIASRIPNARLVVIDDANHMVAVEKPQEVIRLVKEFLM